MASTFSWLSYDDSERQRTLEVVESLKAPGTLDELGFGTIRDTISGQLFPAASTLHRRARYFTFVPALLAQAAASGPAEAASTRFSDFETALIRALLKGDPNAEGIIGREALGNLKTKPSAMYWTALRRYGLITVDRGAGQILRTSVAQRLGAAHVVREEGDDSPSGMRVYGIDPEAAAGWLPSDWKKVGVTFVMEDDEARYLRERIMTSTEGSLYWWFLKEEVDPQRFDYAWEHPARDEFPEPMRVLLEHSRRFHHLVYGATLAYNQLVSGLTGPEALGEEYEERFRRWDARMAEGHVLDGWAIDDFLALVSGYNPRLHRSTKDFVRRWHAVAVRAPSPERDREIERIIGDRELQTKKTRARLHNAKARDGWQGGVGLMALDYNWSVMRRIVRDILGGADDAAA